MNEQVPQQEGTMTFWEHLNELRARVIKMILAFFVGSVAAWVYKEPFLEIVTRPFVQAFPEGSGGPSLHFQAPASLFLAYIKLSILAGFVLALPILLYQVWAFVAPGLYSKEKRLAIPFVVSSCALFAGGGYFGWKVAFPMAFKYLLGFAPAAPIGGGLKLQPTVMIDYYLEFVMRMFLAFGAVFELPVLVFFLSIAGLINHTHLIKFARYFVVIAFILGAIITPPDPTSQLLLAIPLCVLYVFSIGVAWLFGKRPSKAEA